MCQIQHYVFLPEKDTKTFVLIETTSSGGEKGAKKCIKALESGHGWLADSQLKKSHRILVLRKKNKTQKNYLPPFIRGTRKENKLIRNKLQDSFNKD